MTVLVPAQNEEHFIGTCLASIVSQDYPPDRLEVIVVDGGSTDATAQIATGMAERASLPVEVIDNPRGNTSAGLNLGIGRARGDVIVYAIAHGELSADFVRMAVETLERTGADAVGGPIETRGEGTWGQAIAAALSSPFGVGGARFRYSRQETEVDTVAFAAYRREVFEKVGAFDERMAGDEDGDFHARLRATGGRIVLSPAIHAVYHARSSLGALARQYLAYGAAKARTARRHAGTLRAYHLAPAGLVAAASLAAVGPGPLRRVGRVGVGAYLVAAGVASASRVASAGFRVAARLPVVFAVIHLSYGAGWLAGWTGTWAPRPA